MMSLLDSESSLDEQENIKIQVQVSDQNIRVLGNSGRIQQVIMNLISNAKDAIGDGNS
jgi:signal transduction histidine kinase